MINRNSTKPVKVTEEDEEMTKIVLMFERFEDEVNDWCLEDFAEFTTRTAMVNYIINMESNGYYPHQYQVSEEFGEWDSNGPLLADDCACCNADWWIDELNKNGYLTY